jgi:hypothetical protein
MYPLSIFRKLCRPATYFGHIQQLLCHIQHYQHHPSPLKKATQPELPPETVLAASKKALATSLAVFSSGTSSQFL